MGDQRRFSTNQNEVAAKVMDGEAIILNIANGSYYSITGAGAAAWEGLERGLTLDEVVARLAGTYQVSQAVLESDMARLLSTLLEEGLLAESSEAGQAPAADPGGSLPRLPYQPPVFEKFTDMADMLALDPPMPGFDETPWARPAPGSMPQE